MLENIGNTITHLAMDQLGQNLAGRIPSRSRRVGHNVVAMATAVALQRTTGHSAVMGVWRPNAWTKFWWNLVYNRKFGPQWQSFDQILNFFFKFKMMDVVVGNIRNAITRSQWTEWVVTWVVASHYVPNFGNARTPLTMGPIGTTLGWSRPSNTSAAKPFPWYWLLLLTAQWTFWFYGVYRSKTSTILMKLGWLCHCGTKKNKIWYKNSKY